MHHEAGYLCVLQPRARLRGGGSDGACADNPPRGQSIVVRTTDDAAAGDGTRPDRVGPDGIKYARDDGAQHDHVRPDGIQYARDNGTQHDRAGPDSVNYRRDDAPGAGDYVDGNDQLDDFDQPEANDHVDGNDAEREHVECGDSDFTGCGFTERVCTRCERDECANGSRYFFSARSVCGTGSVGHARGVLAVFERRDHCRQRRVPRSVVRLPESTGAPEDRR